MVLAIEKTVKISRKLPQISIELKVAWQPSNPQIDLLHISFHLKATSSPFRRKEVEDRGPVPPFTPAPLRSPRAHGHPIPPWGREAEGSSQTTVVVALWVGVRLQKPYTQYPIPNATPQETPQTHTPNTTPQGGTRGPWALRAIPYPLLPVYGSGCSFVPLSGSEFVQSTAWTAMVMCGVSPPSKAFGNSNNTTDDHADAETNKGAFQKVTNGLTQHLEEAPGCWVLGLQGKREAPLGQRRIPKYWKGAFSVSLEEPLPLDPAAAGHVRRSGYLCSRQAHHTTATTSTERQGDLRQPLHREVFRLRHPHEGPLVEVHQIHRRDRMVEGRSLHLAVV